MTDLKLAIAGLGAIGMRAAQAVDRGEVHGIKLVAVSANDKAAAAEKVSSFRTVPTVIPLEELASVSDTIVECTPASVFETLARPVLKQGKHLLPLSVGALLRHPELIDLAGDTGARITVPTGALIGLDTVRAMAVGEIFEVTLKTTKHPRGLEGAPHLIDNNIDISNLSKPTCVLKGSAREAALGFPANVNVAAALALAGIGPDKTQVEVWADPNVERNIQSVTIRSDSGEATMTMNNIPSPENPRTGRIVANSVIATLQRLTAPLTAGG